MVQVVVHGLEDGLREGRAEGLALPVDVRVVRAGEVDALEDAAALLGFGAHALEGDLAGRGDEHRDAGLELPHVLGAAVEGGLDGRAFGGDRDGAVHDAVEAGADAVLVPHGEAPAVAREAAERVGAVRAGEDRGERVDDLLAARGHAVDLGMEHLGRQPFRQHVAVRARGRVLAELDVGVEQLARVGEVEVAREHQRAAQPGRRVDEGMAEALVALAEGRVAEMPEEGARVEALRDPRGPRQQVGKRVRGGGLHHLVGGHARLRVELQRRESGAVLPAVVLLLEQQGDLRKSGRRAHLGVRQPNHRDRALVLDLFRHPWYCLPSSSDAGPCRVTRPARVHVGT